MAHSTSRAVSPRATSSTDTYTNTSPRRSPRKHPQDNRNKNKKKKNKRARLEKFAMDEEEMEEGHQVKEEVEMGMMEEMQEIQEKVIRVHSVKKDMEEEQQVTEQVEEIQVHPHPTKEDTEQEQVKERDPRETTPLATTATLQRLLQPLSTFDNITIWNPDIELDKGDDVYVRALKEWTALSRLVCIKVDVTERQMI